jgi:surfeit locus 1 family protein
MRALSMTNPSIVNVDRNWHFVIKPLYSFIMLLGIAICLSAAVWQYQKSIFYQAPVAQTLHMHGQFLNEYTHYLDNQTFNGKPGYAVITPFEYENTIYLVNRGFVAYERRDLLPNVKVVPSTVQIEGYLKANHKPLLLNNSLQDPISKRIQFIDEKYFSAQLEQDVSHEVFMLQEGDGQLLIQPRKSAYLSHHRHQGYAIQWLLLGVCGVVILLLASVKRGKKHA